MEPAEPAPGQSTRLSTTSGSGPTLAFLAADRLDAEELSQRLSDVAGVAARAVHGPVHGARIMA